ncbi:MAG: amidohydrolase family protein [Archangium sp.]|nr:amidohydrolase family protein [Archangium sp.]
MGRGGKPRSPRAESRGPAVLLALLLSGCTCASKPAPAAVDAGQRFRKVDLHVHASPRAVPRLLRLMDERGIDVAVNLSGGWPGAGLEEALEAAAKTNGRVIVFANPPLQLLAYDLTPGQLATELEQAHRLGAKGVKFYKALGLGFRNADESLLAVDDPKLDALFEKAGELGMPVSIHTGDPIAFWSAPDEKNERFDELDAHPGWSYFGKEAPSWEALFAAYERRVARHPRTKIIGVHFGNAPELPERVAAMLDKYPNLFVDTAARVPELGRKPAAVRELILRYPERVLFGTDLGVGEAPEDLMFGSTGLLPPTRADADRFFSATWRFFETRDEHFAHPTPIQGRWTISGLGLPPEVLRKVYSENADRLLAPASDR